MKNSKELLIVRYISLVYLIFSIILSKGNSSLGLAIILVIILNNNLRIFYFKKEIYNILSIILEFILIIHVNSYVLVSGYYQSNSTFKQKKIWKIVNASWFYRAVIMIVFLLLNIIEIDIVPIDFEYTSLTIPITNSFILDGIIFEITSNNVCCSILVYCISVINNIKNGINDNIV